MARSGLAPVIRTVTLDTVEGCPGSTRLLGTGDPKDPVSTRGPPSTHGAASGGTGHAAGPGLRTATGGMGAEASSPGRNRAGGVCSPAWATRQARQATDESVA